MEGRGALAALAGAVALAGLGAVGAHGQETPVRAEGSLTVTWRGDPARCASAGLCGVSGSLVYRPGGSFLEQPSPRVPALLPFEVSAPIVARVERREPGLEPAACSDVVRFDLLGVADRRRVRLAPTSRVDASIGGRCGGPTPADLGPALPEATFDPRHPERLGFQGHRTFAAGPFAGEVISTVVVGPGRPDDADSVTEETDSGSARRAPPRPRRRARGVVHTIEYRVERVSGALVTDVRGIPSPACRPLDACGIGGTITHAVDLTGRTLVLRGERRSRRGGRVAFAGDIAVGAGTARTAAELMRPGGATCRDVATGPAPALHVLVYRRRAKAQLAAFTDVAERGLDPVRTRCPGPTRDDVLGDDALARTENAGALAGRRLQLSLRARGGFAAPGYAGARRGEVVVTLRRSAVRVREERL